MILKQDPSEVPENQIFWRSTKTWEPRLIIKDPMNHLVLIVQGGSGKELVLGKYVNDGYILVDDLSETEIENLDLELERWVPEGFYSISPLDYISGGTEFELVSKLDDKDVLGWLELVIPKI